MILDSGLLFGATLYCALC